MKQETLLKICKVIHRISLIIGILTILLPLIFWSKIPDTIPMHYNAVGEVDNYSGKESLILLFFVVAMLMGVMNIVAYYVKSSATSKYATEGEKSWMDTVYPMVIFINFFIQVMFSYIMFCCVTSRALGVWFLPIMMIAIFAPIGFVFFKRNEASKEAVTESRDYQSTEKQEQGISYRSKVDWWQGLILGGSMLWMLWLMFKPIVVGRGVEWTITISTAFMLLLVLPLFAIKYVIYSDHLLVSCSIYGKVRVPYAAIINIKETHNPLSSAALSLDRIQIDYTENGVHRMVLISPIRKKEFMSKVGEYRNIS